MGSSSEDPSDLSDLGPSIFTAITDSITDTQSAIKVLAFTVTAELGAFAMFYVSKDKVLEFIERSDEDVWIYGGIAVFFVGFFTAFALCGLLPIRLRRRLGKLDIWLLSAGAGIANIGLFFLLINFQMR